MKYCQKCGKGIMDQAVICPFCGCMAVSTMATMRRKIESAGLATTALIFAFLVPIVGLILGIVGAATYKTPEYKSRSVTSIFVSVGVFIALCSILMAVSIY